MCVIINGKWWFKAPKSYNQYYFNVNAKKYATVKNRQYFNMEM